MKYYGNEEVNFEELAAMGERIRVLRKKKGYSQMVFAEMVGMSKNSISNIELGQQRVMSNKIQYFAEVLEVTADYILTGATETREDELDMEILAELKKLSVKEKKRWLASLKAYNEV